MTAIAATTASLVEQKVEVVYISEGDREKGQGILQCRAKKHISRGGLRLHPHGGTFLHEKDVIMRSNHERTFSASPCYMRGAKVAARIYRNGGRKVDPMFDEYFILYSAMSHKQLATMGLDNKVELQYFSPYWAVMLADRDTNITNMIACMEDYKWVHPRAQTHGSVDYGASFNLKLPFLTNATQLAPGDLLVLPYNGGMSEILCDKFSAMLQRMVQHPTAMSHK